MRDLDMTSLRLFVTVCETRNIARAGERVNLAGSAISKRLAQLEDHLGVRLLVRRRPGVEPTPAGETLLEHAHTLLGNAERLAHDLGSYAAGVKGQVRVLASASALAESLADDVASFLRQPEHAAIQIHIEERQSRDVVRGVRDGVARAWRSRRKCAASRPAEPVRRPPGTALSWAFLPAPRPAAVTTKTLIALSLTLALAGCAQKAEEATAEAAPTDAAESTEG